MIARLERQVLFAARLFLAADDGGELERPDAHSRRYLEFDRTVAGLFDATICVRPFSR